MDAIDSVAGNRQRVVGFADVVRVPLRRWRTVLAVTGLVLLAVAGYLFLLPATYRGTAVVVLRPVVTDPFTLPSSGADRAINMTAETGVATGNDVVDATSRALSRDPDDVRDALSVEVPTGGAVLRFDYSDDSEARAAAGANTAAQTYLSVREAIYQKQREALLVSYDSTLRQLTDQRKAAQKGIPKDTEDRDGIDPQVQAALDQVAALNDQIAQQANQKAKIASADLSPGAVTASARAPLPSSHDAWLLYLLAGVLGGLLLGTVAAHGREALDRRVRSLDQAADLIGTPALGAVRAPGRHTADAAAADARYVSLALLKWIETHPGRPVVMLSGRDDEGRSAVSVNVAVAIAESGQDVWLVAATELHDAIRSVLFAAQKRTPPRARVLRPGEMQRHNGSPAPGVTVLPAVPGPPSLDDPESTLVIEHTAGQAVLAPPRPYMPTMGEGDGRRPLVVAIGGGVVRLVALGEQPMAGVAVIDAPPSDVDERGVRAAQYGVAVLVVARDSTRNRDLTRLVDRLRSAGAQTAGFVLTGGKGA